ncbi:MAG: hypothetical protein ABIO49_03275 [Dokdonella sp.]
MTHQNAAASVMAAVRVSQNVHAVRSQQRVLNFPLSDREVHLHAQMIEKVIRARRKLQLLRDRAQALEGALGRFKARREARRA